MLQDLTKALNGAANHQSFNPQLFEKLAKTLSRDKTLVNNKAWGEITDNGLRKLILMAGIAILLPLVEMA